eukprot:m.186085 g.186085  ORF g.186085 m.186085 type:complete len:72 (+) comp10524_c0_seq8:1638-1853(+)
MRPARLALRNDRARREVGALVQLEKAERRKDALSAHQLHVCSASSSSAAHDLNAVGEAEYSQHAPGALTQA